MCFQTFERTVATLHDVLKCPARRAVYLTERPVHKNFEFVDRKFLNDIGSTCHSSGVLIDGDLYLIHLITHLDRRNPGKRQAYATLHFLRASQTMVSGHFYFIAPPGDRRRLLKIPSADILAAYFPEHEPRDELTANMPWEYTPPGCPLPFDAYELPVVETLAH